MTCTSQQLQDLQRKQEALTSRHGSTASLGRQNSTPGLRRGSNPMLNVMSTSSSRSNSSMSNRGDTRLSHANGGASSPVPQHAPQHVLQHVPQHVQNSGRMSPAFSRVPALLRGSRGSFPKFDSTNV
jgi:hypothetical protein